MADQRILLKWHDREIMLAKRVGYAWIAAQDDINDLADFLDEVTSNMNSSNSNPQTGEIEICYEDPQIEGVDPDFKFVKGEVDKGIY